MRPADKVDLITVFVTAERSGSTRAPRVLAAAVVVDSGRADLARGCRG